MRRFINSLFEAIIKRIQKAFETIESFVRGIQSTVNRILSLAEKVFKWIVDKINAVLQKIYNAWDQIVQKLNEYMEAARAPITLHACSVSWIDSVNIPMGYYESAVGEDSLISEHYWGGEAGNAYRKSTNDQSAAGAQITELAEATSDTLEDCAMAGFVFYGAIAVAVAEIVGSIAAAAIETATVVGTVPALLTLLGGFLGALGAIGTAFAAFLAFEGSVLSGGRGFKKARAKFKRPKWPSGTMIGA
jgi:hypothetical protein